MDTAETLFVIEYITPTGDRRTWGTTFRTLAEAQGCAHELTRDRVASYYRVERRRPVQSRRG